MNKKIIKSGLVITWILLIVAFSKCCISYGYAQTTDYVVLGPGQDKVYTFDIHKGDTLTFTIDITYGSLSVILWESEQWVEQGFYEDYWSTVTYKLTEEFSPWWSDTFYLEIHNPSVSESASFQFTYKDDNKFRNSLIINICISGGLLGVILVTNFLGKKPE